MDARRPQTPGEELANALSHALGCVAALVAALAALPALDWRAVMLSMQHHPGAWVFGSTMSLVFLASALFHALPEGPLKRALQRLDHAAIFLFIAGSYTPFALHHVPGGPSWLVLGGVWAAAALGMALKLLNRLRHRGRSTALYFAFGWLVLLAAQPVVDSLSREGLALVVGGGLAYTVGTVFFLLDHRLRYGHLVWHLFVLLGSGCHFAAVLGYAA